MKRCSPKQLNFLRPRESIPTVEVDIDSLPDGNGGCAELLRSALSSLAARNPKLVGTIYIMVGGSVSFGSRTVSAFIGVAGPKRLLPAVFDALQRLGSVRVRYGEEIDQADGRLEVHIQDGLVWLCEDDATWYAEKHTSSDLPDEINDEFVAQQISNPEDAMGMTEDSDSQLTFDASSSAKAHMACSKCLLAFEITENSVCDDRCGECGGKLCSIVEVPEVLVFFEAVIGNWERVFEIIDENGLNPNLLGCPIDKWGFSRNATLMLIAAARLNLDSCRELANRQANMALGQVRRGNCPPIVWVLLFRDGTQNKERYQVIKFLGETVNEADTTRDGKTALFAASTGHSLLGWNMHKGHVGLVKLLLSLGADVMQVDNRGNTALFYAIEDMRASRTEANIFVVNLLKEKTIEKVATNLFQKEFAHSFSDSGHFEYSRKHSTMGESRIAVAPPQLAATDAAGVANGGARSRQRSARSDAHVSTIRKKIEAHFGLPEGCVALVDKKNRPLRGDALIGTVWKHHQ